MAELVTNSTIQDQIHEKGFNLYGERYQSPSPTHLPQTYGSIKVGTKSLDDAILNLGSFKKIHKDYGNKLFILEAIKTRNLPLLREISNFFYNTNGIYSRICDYFAYLYRYDWYITPEIFDDKVKTEKVLTDFDKILTYLDNSHIKKLCGEIALEVIKNGAYYGYIVPSSKGLVLQPLPINYCRTRFFTGDTPVIEFNLRFFDDYFPNLNYRLKILKMFPKEFQIGYRKFKQGLLPPDVLGQSSGSWIVLDPGSTVKFCFPNGDQPFFINSIPSLLDLDTAQDLDRKKQMQQLLKIVIQKLPLDKNGDLIFDVDEARDIHNNAVEMLSRAIGVDVLTTFADVQVEDMADTNSSSVSSDSLEHMERTVFNSFGISRNIFNTDSNLALEKSILDDESTMRVLLLQFHVFLDKVTQSLGKNKSKYNYRLYMLETTQYNYKDLSKMYKEQVQIGYSKMLPQVAMGHSQSSIIHTAFFENEILNLSEIMIPPLMSSTMNAEALLQTKNGSQSKTNTASNGTSNTGRPEKEDSEKSAKTIANKESM